MSNESVCKASSQARDLQRNISGKAEEINSDLIKETIKNIHDCSESIWDTRNKNITEKQKLKAELNAKCEKKIAAMQKKLNSDLERAQELINKLLAGEQVGEEEQLSLFAQTKDHHQVPTQKTVSSSSEINFELVRAYKDEVRELREILNSRALVIEVDSPSLVRRANALDSENYKLKEKVRQLQQQLDDERDYNKIAETWALTESV